MQFAKSNNHSTHKNDRWGAKNSQLEKTDWILHHLDVQCYYKIWLVMHRNNNYAELHSYYYVTVFVIWLWAINSAKGDWYTFLRRQLAGSNW